MIQKIVDYLKYISDKTDAEVWINDEQDKLVFKVALENELLDIREDQTDLDGWFDPDAYIERYASVSDKGMELLQLLADDLEPEMKELASKLASKIKDQLAEKEINEQKRAMLLKENLEDLGRRKKK